MTIAERILVVVEIPQGSRNKYEFDSELGRFKLDRMLFSSMHYPTDYGFIPNTLAEDGDPLDAMVFVAEPTFPGCVIESRPIGVLKMWDEKGMDHKILCAPLTDPLRNHYQDIKDMPAHRLKEIEHFFTVYKQLEKKEVGSDGWEDAAEAVRVIESSKKAFEASGRLNSF